MVCCSLNLSKCVAKQSERERGNSEDRKSRRDKRNKRENECLPSDWAKHKAKRERSTVRRVRIAHGLWLYLNFYYFRKTKNSPILTYLHIFSIQSKHRFSSLNIDHSIQAHWKRNAIWSDGLFSLDVFKVASDHITIDCTAHPILCFQHISTMKHTYTSMRYYDELLLHSRFFSLCKFCFHLVLFNMESMFDTAVTTATGPN